MAKYAQVKQSSIHNKGVFATEFIPKGTIVMEYVGKKVTKKESDDIATKQEAKSKKNQSDGAVYIFTLNDRYDIDGNVSYNDARYINHSCSPNAQSENIRGRIFIKATKNIKEGEEITYDYGFDFEDHKDHPCLCGKPNCIGYIVDRKHWKKILQNKNISKK